MSKLNLLLFLNTYSDSNSTNAPSLNNVRWARDYSGLMVDSPLSQQFSLAAGESKTIFDGTRTLSQDNTTIYSLAVKPLSSNTYVLSYISGSAPNFRTSRTTGADATTQVTVTQNGPVLTFTSTGGTNFSLISGGVVVGDYVRIGSNFSIVNQGEYKIISLSATSFSVENETGTPEGPITLGSGFASQVQAYSALGVQVGDTIVISGGFSPASQGSYKITSVASNFIEFYTTDVLPQENNIQTDAISIYSNAKQLVYMEADQKCSMILNGISGNEIEPFVIGSSTQPGVFLRKSTIWSMSVSNDSLNTANVFIISME